MGQLAAQIPRIRLRPLLIWLFIFLVMLFGAAWIAAEQVAQNVRLELARSLATYGSLRANIVDTFDAMDADLTGPPCTNTFISAMRRIAFLSDGANELLYAPQGTILCAGNSGWLPSPLDLGPPDVAPSDTFGISLWMNQALEPIGLEGLTGSIAGRGDFALAIPPEFMPAQNGPLGMEEELVYRIAGDTWMHRAGVEGIHAQATRAPNPVIFGVFSGAVYQYACDPAGEHCVAARAPLLPLAIQRGTAIVLVLFAFGVIAAWLTQQACAIVSRHWSFEARFLRHFHQDRLVCAYQPILNLRTGLVSGCEVLARWRDHDGTVVMPDQFLPVVEKHELTERFTAMVVAKAREELQRLPGDFPLEVNFNIFPRDLHVAVLVPVLAPFLKAPSRFTAIVELVETAEVDPDWAQAEIEGLRQAGVNVYIDDFGAGYSSMHNLAALPVEGVKLDRSFAMAADHSVMGNMLNHAIELVRASGRALVVEGVETKARLEALKAGGRADFAQGYGIARPMKIDDLARFFAEAGTRSGDTPPLVA